MIRIYRTENGDINWRIEAYNRDVLITSRKCLTKAHALNQIEVLRMNAPNPQRYRKIKSKNRSYRYEIYGRSSHLLVESKRFSTVAEMENNIKSVVKHMNDDIINQLEW